MEFDAAGQRHNRSMKAGEAQRRLSGWFLSLLSCELISLPPYGWTCDGSKVGGRTTTARIFRETARARPCEANVEELSPLGLGGWISGVSERADLATAFFIYGRVLPCAPVLDSPQVWHDVFVYMCVSFSAMLERRVWLPHAFLRPSSLKLNPNKAKGGLAWAKDDAKLNSRCCCKSLS